MIKRLLTALRHPVSNNVIALYGVQLAMFVIPLATLPYVSRVLEPSAFGLVVFSQGLTFTLLVFVDWGFGLTAVRALAAHQGDRAELTAIVRRVRGAQLLLCLPCGIFAGAAFVLVPSMHEHPELLVLAFVAAAASGLAPDWYFLGVERMRVMALITLGFRVVAAALTFVLVKSPDDAWVVMALFAAAAVGGLLVADLLMYREISFVLPTVRSSLREIRAGATIFFGTVAVTLYTAFNVVLLGFFVPSADVAHFGAAERLVGVSITLLGPIGAAVVPRMTALHSGGDTERARRLLVIALLVAALPALAIMAGLILLGGPVIELIYGRDFVDDAVPILRVLALVIPINVVGVVFGVWLMTLHRDRLVVGIVLFAGVANVVLGVILTPMFGPIGMAWSVIAAQALAASGGLIAVRWDARRRLREVSTPVTPEGLT